MRIKPGTVQSAVQTEHDPAVSLGEIAHIVAWTPEGPRGQSQLDARERNRYENLILLCGHHHRLVDRQPHTYTVDALHEMKAAHERRINQLISGSGAIPDPARWLVDANGAFPCMSTVDNRALLGIHPAIELSGDADSLSDQFPTYIGRDFDPLLRQKVQECSQSGGLIVLVGQAASGKSRSAFEAVRAVLPQWRLVVPASSHDLTEFVSAEGDLAKCVIWLDKLAEFLAPGELASRTVQRLITGSGGPTLLIGGLWPTEYDRIRHNNSGHFDHRPHGEVTIEQPSVHRDGRRILDFAVRVELAREFSTSEQSRAKAVAALDPRVAEAVRQEGDHAIASMLAAAPELIHRWRQPSDPVGGQLVSAAIEARLCWHPRRLPVDLLKALTEQRLSTAQKARLDENWFTRALAWACQPVRGDVAALTAHAESIGPAAWYEVSDVLVGDAAHRIFTKERLKVDWDCLLTHAGSSACASIGAFAMHYDVLPRAAQAWRKAIDGGVPGLESLLAITLFDLDDLSGARQWYERAVRCGTLETADIPMLAVICEEMGEPDARDHWLQLAADAGDPAAWWAQGRIAEEEGDDETAAVKYLKAVEFGDPGGNALNSLGVQLSRRDDRTGARHYYQRAIDEHDHPHAMLNLGLMLGQEGDEQGSISLIYRAALADIPEAAARIGELLRADGDDAGAVTWLQRAAEHGVVNAIAGLAGVLWKTGHTQQAQQWFILGIKQGDLACTFGLGMLLDALGETETARGLLSTAAHRGQPGAAGRYALFLVENGDYSSAKEWLQQAHDEGDPLAAVTATMWAHRAN